MPDLTPAEIVHACPSDGSGLTSCCRRNPAELPRTDRITSSSDSVTCTTGPVSDPALVQRVVEALRAAAHDCDSIIDGDATACRAQHPIQVGAWHHGQVSDVYGPVSAIAAVAASVVAAELRAARNVDGPWIRAYREDLEDAQDAINRVRKIHQPVPVKPWPEGPSLSPISHCACGSRWPCPTARALTLTNATVEETR